ncbi:tripartite tricarboxylate transporter substrate binding protein [Cupriavidus sp. AU9028]|uniref:Bug family tripartite tricarboxylate transporter substrate binding protein n=1 Tax=Cupriavidus sp. AU9028 TaxID=2871157 RepID=UPI001C974438|nr:tripartite tricarboxylate transporter substrate binding protein [Cupriavidus sp. AU9028]MBY4897092.1 tripartite tricarboxylate transporter substrate binding protein [Cupriavidus sp. AU9028]
MKTAAVRSLRASATGFILAMFGTTSAIAQAGAYPGKPVETIVPYSVGGGVAAMARAFAAEAAKDTGQQWVVSAREGAGGVVGFSFLARAKPDGYTVVFSPASPMTNAPFVNARMPFTNDQIEPVCQVFENVFAIAVRQESPIQTFAGLMTMARQAPGGVSYGHAGPGSVAHLSMAAVERAMKVRFNAIGYRGDGPLLTDAMGGTLDFSVPAISSLAGKNLRILAVLSDRRHPAFPNVPSIAELGVPPVTPGLNGLFVPAGTPATIVSQMERICEKVTNSSAFAESAKVLHQVPKFLGSAAFKERIAATYNFNAALVPDLKLEKN